MKRPYLFLLVCLFTLQSRADEGRIKGVVHIRAKENRADINLLYYISALDSSVTQFRFYFAQEATIKKVWTDELLNYYVDTSSRLPTLVINLKNPTKRKGGIELTFDYSFPLDSMNYNKYGFIELGLDWFWYPVHPRMSEWDFKYDLYVTVDDQELELFSNGLAQRITPNSFGVTSLYPDFDMDLFLIRSPKLYEDEEKVIRIVGSANNALLKDSLVRLTKVYLDHYRDYYGSDVKQVTFIIRPIVNDPNGFGYARKGYFVLSEPARLNQMTFYIAHELAHFWWLNGEPTENAWITESFAEYNAMLTLKKFEGDSIYRLVVADKYQRVERMKKDGRAVPVVYGAGSKNKTNFSHIALYQKGAIILHELGEKIGEEKMEQLLKKAASKKISTTEEFLDLLKKYASKEIVEETVNKLKTY